MAANIYWAFLSGTVLYASVFTSHNSLMKYLLIMTILQMRSGRVYNLPMDSVGEREAWIPTQAAWL